MKKYVLVLFLVSCLILLTGCPDQKVDGSVNTVTDINQPQRVSFIGVGDNLIHDAIYEAAYQEGTYNFIPFYAEMKPMISSYDLAFINQETMLGGVEIGLSSYPSFNSPVEVGEALIDAGFNLFSIANNHTLDRGEKAILNTINFFKDQDCVYSGAESHANASNLKIFSIGDVTFGFIAYTMLTNGQVHPEGKTHLANVYSREKVQTDLTDIKDQVDFLLVSMHWGNEYEPYPTEIQRNEAEYLASFGVDVIIGHHPHVIQPIEWLEVDGHETLVIYSLGNFLSAQRGIDRKIGMAVSFDFIKDEDSLTIENVEATLLYHYKSDEGLYRVIPYQAVTSHLLPSFEDYKAEKAMLIKSYEPSIVVH